MTHFLCRLMKIHTWNNCQICKCVHKICVHCFVTAAASLSDCHCSARHLKAPNVLILHSIFLPHIHDVGFLLLFQKCHIAHSFFNLTIIGQFNCCCHLPGTTESVKNINHEDSNVMKIPTIMYKKENESEETNTGSECVLCLSPYEDGECIRQLPTCNHVFHASCINVWLSSHSNCLLSRTLVNHVLMGRRHQRW